MPNVHVPEESTPATTPLAQRITACRDQLTGPAAQADELHDTASIFGWAYLRRRS
ncbi:hypothetical protein ACFVZR_37690 [Streptomyces sp. NPDC058316]|uniref:hypothetical protein n=1 Tax=unclassified Streptomyces TaxID=2593676 RepID=UPI003330C8DA